MIIDKVKGGYKKRGFLVFSWSLLKRVPFRDAFFYEKSLKQIFMLYASRLQHYLFVKMNVLAVPIALLTFLAEKTENFRQKNSTLRA
jgi:hypothetical protein